jgi:ArsR family metal-binding transcriptional regulator
MLLTGYRQRFVLPPNPTAQHLRCFAHLEEEIGEVLPYLNTFLKGYRYHPEPPSLTLKYRGKLITLTSREIAINMVKDEAEAGHILAWLRKRINETWARRGEIKPSFVVAAPPRIMEIFKLLPKTNCGACGQPTCLAFAVGVSQGSQRLDDCSALAQEGRQQLREYLLGFYAMG